MGSMAQRLVGAIALITILSMGAADVVFAQSVSSSRSGILIRVNRDAEVAVDENEGTVIVVNGIARIDGTAESVIVVNGDARLACAKVGTLVMINGTAHMCGKTVVSGNVHLINSTIVRDDSVAVKGGIIEGSGQSFAGGAHLFGFLFSLGAGIALIVCGLIAAAIVPHGVRGAGQVLSTEPLRAFGVAVLLWIGLPLIAIAAFLTIIGIPVGVSVLVFLLPALGFLGYIVTGIMVGDYLIGVIRHRDEAWHPYLAATFGMITLFALGTLPVVGGTITMAAGVMGAGAMVVYAWRVAHFPSRANAGALSRSPAVSG